MTNKLGFGFIGAGEIAVASAKALQGVAQAFIAGVYDLRQDLAQNLASTYGGRVVGSVEELLKQHEVAAVYICAPHYLHAELAEAAAAAGKHVFVEKPMGVSPDDAQRIIEACRQNQVACGVPFLVRYAPAYREAHGLVRGGAIGQVTGFRITYRGDKPASYWQSGYSGRTSSDWRQHWATAGGGVMIMNTIHDLDAILWITGLEVEQAQGVIATISGHGEVEDVAMAILHCSRGAHGSLEGMAALPGGAGPGQRWINRIYGSTGQIVLPSPWGTEPFALYTRATGQWQEIVPAPSAEARQQAFGEYTAAVLANTAVPIPGEAGLRASQVLHAVYRAARQGKPAVVSGSRGA